MLETLEAPEAEISTGADDAEGVVTIYSQENCVQCTGSKKFVERHGIPNVIVDITNDDSTRDALRVHGIKQMPIIIGPDGKVFGGFDAPSLLAYKK